MKDKTGFVVFTDENIFVLFCRAQSISDDTSSELQRIAVSDRRDMNSFCRRGGLSRYRGCKRQLVVVKYNISVRNTESKANLKTVLTRLVVLFKYSQLFVCHIPKLYMDL